MNPNSPHNPENVPLDQIPSGWRLLTVGEASAEVPESIPTVVYGKEGFWTAQFPLSSAQFPLSFWVPDCRSRWTFITPGTANPPPEVYYVSVDGASAPSVPHQTLESAMAEAERLVSIGGLRGPQFPCTARVLREVASITRKEVRTFTTEWSV